MPVQRATKDGKPGFRYGKSGKVYTYTPGNVTSRNKAKQKAHLQGAAIEKRTGEKH